MSSSATTNISPRDGSITAVPVMPTVGEMFPHGRSDDGTAEARCRDHTTDPRVAFSE